LIASGYEWTAIFSLWLPAIDNQQRIKAIKELEAESQKKKLYTNFLLKPPIAITSL